jgi:hypothetical protein
MKSKPIYNSGKALEYKYNVGLWEEFLKKPKTHR